MKINNKLLCLFEGRCWHRWEGDARTDYDGQVYDFTYCKHCHAMYVNVGDIDYATNAEDQKRLLQYLMGQGEMWLYFEDWTSDQWYNIYGDKAFDQTWNLEAVKLTWLFLPVDSIPRWLLLLQEWLELEETRDMFGWKGCPEWGDCTVTVIKYGCDKCDGTGKVLTEWARLVQDGKEG